IKWNARAGLTAFLLTPALVAAAVWWGGLEGAARWGALAGGVVLSAAVMLALRNYLPVRNYADLRRRLAEKLARGLVREVDTSGTEEARSASEEHEANPRPQGAPHPAPGLCRGSGPNGQSTAPATGGTFVSFAPDASPPRVRGLPQLGLRLP